ncbi:hypothetical protein D3C80_1286440 [compost metagenome]
MTVIEATQQRRTQWLAVVTGPLIDHQPAPGVQALLTVFQKTPGQVRDARTMVGIQVDEDQVGAFGRLQQLHRITDTDIQARVIIQAHVLDGQARHIRAQFNGLDVFQRQELQAGLSQGAGTQAQKQRAFRFRVGQRTNQHGTGIVVLQPARVGGEHAALLDRLAELEEAIVLDFQHADSAVLVMHLGQQPLYPFLCHAVSRQAPLYHAKNRHCPSMAPVQQGAPQLLTWQTALFRPDRARDEPPLES